MSKKVFLISPSLAAWFVKPYNRLNGFSTIKGKKTGFFNREPEIISTISQQIQKVEVFLLNILKLLMRLFIKKEKRSMVANGNFVGTKSITDTNYN